MSVSWKISLSIHEELLNFSSQAIFLPSPIHLWHKLNVIVKLEEMLKLLKFLGIIALISFYKKSFLGYRFLGNALLRQVKQSEEMFDTIWYLWTQDVNWTFIRRSEVFQGIFWLSDVPSVYVLCPGGKLTWRLRWLLKWVCFGKD